MNIYEGQRRRYSSGFPHTITLIDEHQGIVQFRFDDGAEGTAYLATYEDDTASTDR